MKIRKKINAEKLSVQPSLFSTLSLFQPSFSFSFNAAHFFFFLFPGQPPLFLLLFSSSAPPFLLFVFLLYSFVFSVSFFFSSRCVALFLLAQNTFFQPKRFSVFQPKRFCFSSATLLFFFFLLYSFLVQPSFFSFSASFFSFL